jgi:hypothetical protein
MRLFLVCVGTTLLTAVITVALAVLLLIMSSGAWWDKFWTDPNATFAAAVAVFTLLLVVVGFLQARSISLQYRATVALEGAVFAYVATKLVPYADEHSTVALADHVDPGMPPDFCRVLVLLGNIGRSNATIRRACIQKLVSQDLPPTPTYQHIEDWPHTILPPGTQTWAMFDRGAGDVRLTLAERNDIAARRCYLWVYGYFTYSDFMGNFFTHGFLGRWDIIHGFVREISPVYEFQVKGAKPP